jgi:hypothetical protein
MVRHGCLADADRWVCILVPETERSAWQWRGPFVGSTLNTVFRSRTLTADGEHCSQGQGHSNDHETTSRRCCRCRRPGSKHARVRGWRVERGPTSGCAAAMGSVVGAGGERGVESGHRSVGLLVVRQFRPDVTPRTRRSSHRGAGETTASAGRSRYILLAAEIAVHRTRRHTGLGDGRVHQRGEKTVLGKALPCADYLASAVIQNTSDRR